MPGHSKIFWRRQKSLIGSFAFAVLVTAVSGAAASAAHGAQQMDHGTFRLFVGTDEVGSEEFTVQRSGSGEAQVIIAKGTITMRDGRNLTTFLRVTGPDLVLNDYEAVVTGSDTLAVRLARGNDQLETRTIAPWGEEAAQYRAHPRSILLDQGVAHHYFVLGLILTRTDIGTIHSLAPLAQQEETLTGLETGQEVIEVDGQPSQVTRVRLSSETGGARTAWFDGSGRLVRVAVDNEDFIAERTANNQ